MKIITLLPPCRYQILRLKYTKFDFSWGSAPYTLGELTALLHTLYLDLRVRGANSKGMEGQREGREWKGRKKRGGEGHAPWSKNKSRRLCTQAWHSADRSITHPTGYAKTNHYLLNTFGQIRKQDNVHANSESVQCRVFQTRKVYDYTNYQYHHFFLFWCTWLLYIKHTYTVPIKSW